MLELNIPSKNSGILGLEEFSDFSRTSNHILKFEFFVRNVGFEKFFFFCEGDLWSKKIFLGWKYLKICSFWNTSTFECLAEEKEAEYFKVERSREEKENFPANEIIVPKLKVLRKKWKFFWKYSISSHIEGSIFFCLNSKDRATKKVVSEVELFGWRYFWKSSRERQKFS